MASKLKIPGTSCNTSAKADELMKETIPLPLTIAVQEVVDVTSAREGGGTVTVALAPPQETKQRKTGHVCEVEMEGDVTLWLRPASLYRDFGVPRARGAPQTGEEDIWEIAPTLSRRGAARGLADDLGVRKVTVYRWQRPAEPLPKPSAEGEARGVAAALAEAGVGLVTDIVAGAIADRFAGSVGRAVERHQLKGKEPGLYKVELMKG